jgi:hypothetical protein
MKSLNSIQEKMFSSSSAKKEEFKLNKGCCWEIARTAKKWYAAWIERGK